VMEYCWIEEYSSADTLQFLLGNRTAGTVQFRYNYKHFLGNLKFNFVTKWKSGEIQ